MAAVRLAAQGFSCALVARTQKGLEETAKACLAAGGEAQPFAVDLTDPDSGQRLLEASGRWRGPPQLLLNMAGAFHHGSLAGTPHEVCDHLLDINLRALIHLTRQVLPPMQAAKGGLIINIASVAGLRGIAEESVYAASKHGLVGFSHSLSRELGATGIKVSVICPGLVATDMAEGRGAQLDRALSPEDVADAIDFVVASSPRACPTQVVLEPLRSPWTADTA